MTTIKLRRGTAAQWTTVNPILAQGEPGFETDTGKHKIGNGITNWAGLKYYIDEVDLSNAVSGEVSARNTAINTAVSNLINGAPTALDTLLELSAQLAGDESAVGALVSSVSSHVADHNNPHVVTKNQVGLGNVPNIDTTAAIATAVAAVEFIDLDTDGVPFIETGVPPTVNLDTAVATYIGAPGGPSQIDAKLSTSYIPAWKPSTAYAAGAIVMTPDGSIVKRLTSGTSGLTYSSTNWQTVATVNGTQANTELKSAFVGKGSLVINVQDYGAKGDMTSFATGSGTDDTTTINLAFTAASAAFSSGLSPIVEFPQVAFGYRTTAGITVPDNVDVRMWSPIVYDGAGGETALTVGSGTRQANRTHRLNVRRVSISSWSNEADEGIRIYSHYYSDINIAQAENFTVGVNLWGKATGFVYNKITLGRFGNNKIGLNLTNSLVGWCNQNKFFGGSWTIGSTTYTTTDAVGIRITSVDGTYVSNNANTFYGPSFELQDSGSGTGAGERIPVLVEYGSQNTFRDVRNEGSSPIVIRSKNAAQNNRVFMEWNAIGSVQISDDQGTNPSSKVTQGGVPITAESTRLIAQWSDLHHKACYYDGGTQIHIPGLNIGTSSTTPVEGSSQSGVTLATTYLEISNSRHLGFFVDTRVVKRFSVVVDFDSGFGGRLHVRAYNSSGTVLTSSDPNAPYVKSVSNSVLTYTTSWGGSYAAGGDSTAVPSHGRYFAVGPDVDHVFVGLSGGTNPLRLRGLALYTPDSGQCSTWLTAHTTDDFRNYGSTFPTSGTWELGRVVLNDVPSTNGPVGWQCTTSGTPGTWKAFGAPPGAAAALPVAAGLSGMVGWAFDPAASVGGTTLIAGTLTGTRVHLPYDSTVTNLIVYVATAGVTLTSGQCFAALYTTAGVFLGTTADQSAAWQSTGTKVMAVAGGPLALTGGFYEVAFFANGTTPPFMLRGLSGTSVNANQTTSANARFWTADTGLTTAAPSPRGTKTTNGVAWWAGLS